MNSDHAPFTMAGGNRRTAPPPAPLTWRKVATVVAWVLALPVGSYLYNKVPQWLQLLPL